MRVFLVDDEQPCLDELSWQLSHYPDIKIAGTFVSPIKAAQAIETDRPDAVFLDIDMPRMSGLELAQRIQEKHAGVIILFVTAYKKYALDAYQAYPLDFLVKPVPDKRLIDTVSHLRRQYALLHPESERRDGLNIRCFGSFEIISDSTARFPTRRVKELLLYLIDRRGVAATRGELLDALFGGKNDMNTLNNLYVTLSRLKTLLYCWDHSRSLIRLTEDNTLVIAPGVCDYTDFMRFAKRNAALSAQNAREAAGALALCRGPYLENETCEWALESTRDVEDEYERVALSLSGFLAAEGNAAEAESVLGALLARNPLCAEGYNALLNLYMKTGDRAAFTARYEEYARVLKKELRIKPAAIYREHYEAAKR
jgi:two-component SAPR family response regulator